MVASKALSIDVARVRKAVKSKLGVEPEKVKKLSATPHSQSFDIQSSKGRFVFTAVSKQSNGKLARQSWCYSALSKSKVPVPKVVAVDTKKKIMPHEFMITSFEPGEYLCDVFPSKPVMRKELGRSVGQVFAKVHKVDVKGFGLLNEKGVGQKKVWDAVAFEQFDADIAYIKRNKLLKPEEIQAISDMVEKRKAWLECKKPVLINSSLELENVLAIGNDVSSVLGFGQAKGGDPAREFGRLYSSFYFNRERPFVEAVRVSYETTLGKRLDMKRVWLYCLMDRVKSFREDIEIDNTEPALAKKYHRTYLERVMRQVAAYG
ncbi:MAG: phosphotransferase [Nanoarchaeota archaeon]